jgi:hypothetical protein
VNFSLDIFAAARYGLLDGAITKTALSESDRSASDALELFQAASPAEFFARQRVAAGQAPEKGIHTAAVVGMLVILQRLLRGKATLSGAVRQIPERTDQRTGAQP